MVAMTLLLYVAEPAAVVPVTSLPPDTDPSALVGETVLLVTPRREDEYLHAVERIGASDTVVGLARSTLTPENVVPRGPRWVGEATIAGFTVSMENPPERMVVRLDGLVERDEETLPEPECPECHLADGHSGCCAVRCDVCDGLADLRCDYDDVVLCDCGACDGYGDCATCWEGWFNDSDEPCARPRDDELPGRVAIPGGGVPGEMRRWAP